MLSTLRHLGASATALLLLALGAQACMHEIAPALPAPPAATAAVAATARATATPPPPTPPTPEPLRADVPIYAALEGPLAAGWTPAARDLTVGPQLYRRLDERDGASCRIEVVTGQDAGGRPQTAAVWTDCEALP